MERTIRKRTGGMDTRHTHTHTQKLTHKAAEVAGTDRVSDSRAQSDSISTIPPSCVIMVSNIAGVFRRI